MELTMAAQEDATPWVQLPSTMVLPNLGPANSKDAAPILLRGRGDFSQLSLVRTKPGRADSPPTLSKSCSDKLSSRQVLSVLSTPTCYLIAPTPNAYIQSLILPQAEYCKEGCRRAFGPTGRMKDLVQKEDDLGRGYRYRPFEVLTTSAEFEYSRRKAIMNSPLHSPISSNISTLWASNMLRNETLISGVLQGRKAFPPPKFAAGTSKVCKMGMWATCVQLAKYMVSNGANVGPATQERAVRENLEYLLGCEVYDELKSGLLSRAEQRTIPGISFVGMERRETKEGVRGVLKGWQRNGGNDFRYCVE